MLLEEVAIWSVIGMALLLVGAIFRREAMHATETFAHKNRQRRRPVNVGDPVQSKMVDGAEGFDERAWLARNRYPRALADQLASSLRR